MKSDGELNRGCFGFIVVSVLLAAPVAFLFDRELMAFLIIGLGCFLMLCAEVAVLVIINNRQEDELQTAQDSKDRDS